MLSLLLSLVTGLFFLALLLNQRWSPTLRLQVSHCSTFRIMCDVRSTAVFCSESIECFPGISSKFFLKLLVTIPVTPIITGKILHFRFHIRCISILLLLLIVLDSKRHWRIINENQWINEQMYIQGCEVYDSRHSIIYRVSYLKLGDVFRRCNVHPLAI